MSEYMGDLSQWYNTSVSTGKLNTKVDTTGKTDASRTTLDMSDFLALMVAELTNQSIDDTADTSDMLNQMVQMQMITAMNNMTDASVMSYAASLVGKEVTVGQYDSKGVLQEVVGQVTGTGTMDGNQVVFVGDKYYQLSEIMAVGRLPETNKTEETEPDDTTSGDTEPDGTEAGETEEV